MAQTMSKLVIIATCKQLFVSITFWHRACEILIESENIKELIKDRPELNIPVSAVNQRMASVLQPSARPTTKSNPARKGRTKNNDNKRFEKAVKAAETANKKVNKKAECLKVITGCVCVWSGCIHCN